MLHLVSTNRNYDPETVSIMTAAFDAACRTVQAEDNEKTRETLALIILRHVDDGERNVGLLCDLAALEFARMAAENAGARA